MKMIDINHKICLLYTSYGRVGVLEFDAVFQDLIDVFSTTPKEGEQKEEERKSEEGIGKTEKDEEAMEELEQDTEEERKEVQSLEIDEEKEFDEEKELIRLYEREII